MPRWQNPAEHFEPTSGPTSQYTFFVEMAPLPNMHSNSNTNIDAWPRGIPHYYVSDARRAIIAAINQTWDDLSDTSMIGANDGEEGDTIIEADLLLRKFYTDYFGMRL